jgi:hypothetical protein
METRAAVTWSLHQRVVPQEANGFEAKYRLGQTAQSAGQPEQVLEAASPAETRAAALNQRVRPNVERRNVVHPQASAIGVAASRYHAETRGTRGLVPADAKGCS